MGWIMSGSRIQHLIVSGEKPLRWLPAHSCCLVCEPEGFRARYLSYLPSRRLPSTHSSEVVILRVVPSAGCAFWLKEGLRVMSCLMTSSATCRECRLVALLRRPSTAVSLAGAPRPHPSSPTATTLHLCQLWKEPPNITSSVGPIGA